MIPPVPERAAGVWIVWSWSDTVSVQSIHQFEIDALREAVGDGFSKVSYVEFGQNVVEAVK